MTIIRRIIRPRGLKSRRFIQGESSALTGTAPVTSAPMTVSVWMNQSSLGTGDAVMSMADDQVTTHLWTIGYNGNNQIAWGVRQGGGGTQWGFAPSLTTVGKWHHVVGVEVASDSRFCYLDGVVGAEGTGNRAPQNVNKIDIARFGDLTPGNLYDGRVSELAVWNVVLSAAEIRDLAAGAYPPDIRRQNLVFFAPLDWRTQDRDLISGSNLVVTNTPTWERGPGSLLRPVTDHIVYLPDGEPAAGGVTLTADPGALALSGAEAAFKVTMIADPGALALSGAAATFEQTLAADPGALILSGALADLLASGSVVLTADPGALVFTGAEADLIAPVLIARKGGVRFLREPDAEIRQEKVTELKKLLKPAKTATTAVQDVPQLPPGTITAHVTLSIPKGKAHRVDRLLQETGITLEELIKILS